MPNWAKVRSDLSPQGHGFVYLDKDALAVAATGNSGDANWTYPSFSTATTVVSGGVTFTATFSPASVDPLRYRLLSSGRVVFEGSVTHAVTASSGLPTLSQKRLNTYDSGNIWNGKTFNIFQVPSGYRPQMDYAGGADAVWHWVVAAGSPSSGSGSSTLVTPSLIGLNNGYGNWWLQLRATNLNQGDHVWMQSLSWYKDS